MGELQILHLSLYHFVIFTTFFFFFFFSVRALLSPPLSSLVTSMLQESSVETHKRGGTSVSAQTSSWGKSPAHVLRRQRQMDHYKSTFQQGHRSRFYPSRWETCLLAAASGVYKGPFLVAPFPEPFSNSVGLGDGLPFGWRSCFLLLVMETRSLFYRPSCVEVTWSNSSLFGTLGRWCYCFDCSDTVHISLFEITLLLMGVFCKAPCGVNDGYDDCH